VELWWRGAYRVLVEEIEGDGIWKVQTLGGKIILKFICNRSFGGEVNWIHLAQVRDK
jgi:hypothetical protein